MVLFPRPGKGYARGLHSREHYEQAMRPLVETGLCTEEHKLPPGRPDPCLCGHGTSLPKHM